MFFTNICLDQRSLDITFFDEIFVFFNENVQELSTEKSKDLRLQRERVKCLESENKLLKDNIFNKQKLNYWKTIIT